MLEVGVILNLLDSVWYFTPGHLLLLYYCDVLLRMYYITRLIAYYVLLTSACLEITNSLIGLRIADPSAFSDDC